MYLANSDKFGSGEKKSLAAVTVSKKFAGLRLANLFLAKLLGFNPPRGRTKKSHGQNLSVCFLVHTAMHKNKIDTASWLKGTTHENVFQILGSVTAEVLL